MPPTLFEPNVIQSALLSRPVSGSEEAHRSSSGPIRNDYIREYDFDPKCAIDSLIYFLFIALPFNLLLTQSLPDKYTNLLSTALCGGVTYSLYKWMTHPYRFEMGARFYAYMLSLAIGIVHIAFYASNGFYGYVGGYQLITMNMAYYYSIPNLLMAFEYWPRTVDIMLNGAVWLTLFTSEPSFFQKPSVLEAMSLFFSGSGGKHAYTYGLSAKVAKEMVAQDPYVFKSNLYSMRSMDVLLLYFMLQLMISLVIDHVLVSEYRKPSIRLVAIILNIGLFHFVALPCLSMHFQVLRYPTLWLFVFLKYVFAFVSLWLQFLAYSMGIPLLGVERCTCARCEHAYQNNTTLPHPNGPEDTAQSSSRSSYDTNNKIKLPLPIDKLPSMYEPTVATNNSQTCKICWHYQPDIFIPNCHHTLCKTCFVSMNQPKCPFCSANCEKGLYIFS